MNTSGHKPQPAPWAIALVALGLTTAALAGDGVFENDYSPAPEETVLGFDEYEQTGRFSLSRYNAGGGAHSADYCLLAVQESIRWFGHDGRFGTVVTNIAGGHDYRLSFWYATAQSQSSRTRFRIYDTQWLDASNNVLQTINEGTYYTNTNWTELTRDWTAPANAAKLRLTFEIESDRGNSGSNPRWYAFDDFSMTDQTAATGLIVSGASVDFGVVNTASAPATDNSIQLTATADGVLVQIGTHTGDAAPGGAFTYTGPSTINLDNGDTYHLPLQFTPPANNNESYSGTFNFATNTEPAAFSVDATGQADAMPLPYYDGFDYPANQSLSNQLQWTTHSGTEDQVRILGGSLPTDLGAIEIPAPAGGSNRIDLTSAETEDVGASFDPVTGEGNAVYASFLLRASAQPTATDYFAHFFEGSETPTYFGRTMIRSSGGGYQLGISATYAGEAPESFAPSELQLGETYFVVVKYELTPNGGSDGNDIASIWVNPPLGLTGEPASHTEFASSQNVRYRVLWWWVGVEDMDPAIGAGRFAFRQNAGMGALDIDELRLGTTWASVTPNGNTDPPAVDSISRLTPPDQMTNTSSVTWQVVFDSVVQDATVNTDDFTVSKVNGGDSISGFFVSGVSGSLDTYEVTVDTGSGDGELQIAVPASATILGANGMDYDSDFASDQTYILERTPPAVVSMARQSPPAEFTNGTEVTWRVTFTEEVQSLGPADFTLTETPDSPDLDTYGIDSVNAVNGLTYDVTARIYKESGGDFVPQDGWLRLDILDATANFADLAGNQWTGDYTSAPSYHIDQIGPAVDSVARLNPPVEATNAQHVTWRVTFNAPFDASTVQPGDFSVVERYPGFSTIQDYFVESATVVDATTVDVAVDTGIGNGEIYLDVVNESGQEILDAEGNACAAHSSRDEDNHYDIQKGQDVIIDVDDNGDYSNILTLTFDWEVGSTFFVQDLEYEIATDEDFTTVVAADYSVATDQRSVNFEGESGQRYWFHIRGQWAWGLGYTEYVPTDGILVDTEAPAVLPAPTDEGDFTNQTTLVFRWIDATDPGGSGVDYYTYEIENSLGAVVDSGDATTTQVSYVAASGLGYSCRVRATDHAGNQSAFSSDSDGIFVDTSAPDPPATVVDGGAYSNNQAIVFTWVRPSDPGGSGVDGYSYMIATDAGMSNVVATGWVDVEQVEWSGGASGQTYYCSVQTHDNTGNVSGYSAPSNGVMLDTQAPTPGVADAPSTNSGGTVVIDYAGASDGDSGLALLTLWVRQDPSLVWTATGESISNPAASGSFNYNLGAPGAYYFGLVAEDNAGNTSAEPTGDGDTVTIYDSGPPTLIEVLPAPGSANETLTTCSLLFNETVTGLAPGDLVLDGDPATTLTGAGAGPYVFEFVQPTTGIATIPVIVPYDACRDLVGNPFAGDNWTYTINASALLCELESSSVAEGGKTSATAAFTATFTGDVTGFTDTDISFPGGNASVSDFTTVNAATYTFDVVPSSEGTIQVYVPSGRAESTIVPGKFNQASNVFSFTYDATPPTVTDLDPATTGPTNLDSLVFDIRFDEPVEGFSGSGDILVTHSGTSHTAVSLAPAYPGATRDYTATVLGISGEGWFTVRVPAGAADDKAGNPNDASPDSVRVYIDNTAPVVVSVTPDDAGPTNADTVVFDIEFNEPVSGFDADIDVRIDHFGTGANSSYLIQEISPTLYQVTVSGIVGNGSFTLGVRAGAAQDEAGNGNAASAPSVPVVVDNANPTGGAITRLIPSAEDTNSSRVVFRVTFNEPVAGVSPANFSVDATGPQSGAVVLEVGGGGDDWTVTVETVESTGVLSVDLDSNLGDIADLAGNSPLSGSVTDGESYRIDRIAPLVLSVEPVRDAMLFDLTSVKVTFDESVTSLTAGALSVNGSSATVRTGGGAGPHTFSGFAPPADGVVNVNLAAGRFVDRSGNLFAGDAWNYDKDSTTLTVTLASTVGARTNSSFVVDVEFSADVQGFAPGDVTANCPIDFTPVTSSTFRITALPTFHGQPIDISVPAGVAQDAYGKQNQASNVISTVYDIQGPVIATRVPGVGADINQLPSVSVSFDEVVVGLAAADLTVNGNAATNLAGSGAGPYVFTGFPEPPNGVVNVALSSAAGQDIAGNAVASDAWTCDKEDIRPQVMLTKDVGDVTSGSFLVTATFTKTITDFTSGDVTLVNASMSDFTDLGFGNVFNWVVHPLVEGTVSASVAANRAYDRYGNGNLPSNAATTTYDATPPGVLNVIPARSSRISSLTSMTLVFNEPVSGVTAGALAIQSASGTNAALDVVAISDQTYRFTVVNPADGLVTATLTSPAINDEAGNPFEGDAWTYEKNSTPLTVVLGSAVGAFTGGPFNVTAVFNKPVFDFDELYLSTTPNATVSGFAATSSTLFTWTMNPTDEGLVAVWVEGGISEDIYGNLNEASNVIETTFDITPPVIDSADPSDYLINGLPSVGVLFSETVTGVSANDLRVNGQPATAVSGSGAGPYTFSGYPDPADGVVNVSLASGGIEDVAGHPFVGDSWEHEKDSTPLTVTLAASPPPGAYTNDPFTVSVTFSRPPVEVTAGDFTVINGQISNFTGFAGEATGQFTVTPIGDGMTQVLLEADSVADIYGNGNLASNTITTTFDETPPEVEEIHISRNSVEILFDEPVLNVNAARLLVDGAPATNVSGNGAGPYVFTGFPQPGFGTFTVRLRAEAAIDRAGNPSLERIWNSAGSEVPDWRQYD